MWIDENIFLLTSIFKFESIEYKKKIINENKNSKILVIFGLKFIIVPSEDSKFNDQKSLSKKILFYENEINFFNEKLKNREFLDKAPSKIIDQHKFKLEEAKKKSKAFNSEVMFEIKFNNLIFKSNKNKIINNNIIFFFTE